MEKGAEVTVSRLRLRDRELRAQRLTYQLKVSRGVNSTTRFNAFLATTKVYIRARRKGVVIIFLHIIWFRHRALGICSDFETWADDVLVALGFPRGGIDLRSCQTCVQLSPCSRDRDPHFKEQAISNWGRSQDRSATPPPWHKAPR